MGYITVIDTGNFIVVEEQQEAKKEKKKITQATM